MVQYGDPQPRPLESETALLSAVTSAALSTRPRYCLPMYALYVQLY
jgi:hypothetical protein